MRRERADASRLYLYLVKLATMVDLNSWLSDVLHRGETRPRRRRSSAAATTKSTSQSLSFPPDVLEISAILIPRIDWRRRSPPSNERIDARLWFWTSSKEKAKGIFQPFTYSRQRRQRSISFAPVRAIDRHRLAASDACTRTCMHHVCVCICWSDDVNLSG